MNNNELDKIIHQISYHPAERLNIFKKLALEKRAGVILRLSRHLRYEIVAKLEKEEVVAILQRLDPDDATDILQLFPGKKRKEFINDLSERLKSDITLLLRFDPETAAGLMNLDYIQVEADDPLCSALKKVKSHEKRTGKLPAILVMDNGKLAGYLPGHELGYGHANDRIKKYVRKISAIEHSASTDEVIDIFRRHPHNKIVVMGHAGNVVGIIYSDDILKLLHEKESSSLYDFAGVHDEETVYDSVRHKTRYRYKWLIINLGTAFLAAFTVGMFEETIAKYVLLAVYMPIVAGMGGNAATQTLAVLVRGIALKQIELKTMWRTLKNELGAGFINGVINGIMVAAVIAIKDQNLMIGLILAAAMVINLLIAAFFGTIVPLVMKRLGKDPASSATIFITTATDVFGFMTFLGLAKILLE